jgi:alpha-D-ribose 1-methylphosphonate 5-triphosphate synthase subunit PhnH
LNDLFNHVSTEALREPPIGMPAAASLAQIGRGLTDPVHGAQQVFRAVLTAMSHPGRVMPVPAAALAGLQAPMLPPALCALLLALLDNETSLWLPSHWATAPAAAYLRFHSGVRLLGLPHEAAFAAVPAAAASPALWSQLPAGTDEAPQDGATLVVEVDALIDGAGPEALSLAGPGIRDTQALRVEGLPPGFWEARNEHQADYPRGIDLLLCCGTRLAAVPRTTQVTQAR